MSELAHKTKLVVCVPNTYDADKRDRVSAPFWCAPPVIGPSVYGCLGLQPEHRSFVGSIAVGRVAEGRKKMGFNGCELCMTIGITSQSDAGEGNVGVGGEELVEGGAGGLIAVCRGA